MPRKGKHVYDEYARAHKGDTAKRMAARRAYISEHGAGAAAGKDIDHKISLRSGGGNNLGNLRARKPGPNRGDKTK